MNADLSWDFPANKTDNLSQNFWAGWLRRYGAVVGAYLLATWLTDAFYMGDTPGYTDSILAYQRGTAFNWDNPFWEFGHLFWRPLGWAFYRASKPLTALFVGADERLQVILALMTLSWVGGLACVLLMRSLAGLMTRREWVANVVTITFFVSNAFINYVQTGSSYIPGLAFLLLAFLLLAKNGNAPQALMRTSLIAATGLAFAVCFWFPFVLAVPAALSLPLLMHGCKRAQIRLVMQTALVSGLIIAAAYVGVMAIQGIHNVAAFKAWMAASSHGYHQRGTLRMLFGLARSFINMGNDGLLFKRYLLHDPFSPVTLWDLFRASLWKFGLFYLFLISICVNLLRTRQGQRLCLVLLANFLPVIFFALFIFEGGMPERYLPLYPALFLSLSYTLGSERSHSSLRWLSLSFMAVMVVANLSPITKTALARQQLKETARVSELQQQLKPHSLVAVSHLQDDVVAFNYNFPFNPINRNGVLHVYNVIEIGADRVRRWRADFALKAQSSWDAGGDVWISKRLLGAQPRPEWNWAEGDDRNVSWRDLAPFFSQFEMGREVGGDDGFVLVPSSAKNAQLLGVYINQTPP